MNKQKKATYTFENSLPGMELSGKMTLGSLVEGLLSPPLWQPRMKCYHMLEFLETSCAGVGRERSEDLRLHTSVKYIDLLRKAVGSVRPLHVDASPWFSVSRPGTRWPRTVWPNSSSISRSVISGDFVPECSELRVRNDVPVCFFEADCNIGVVTGDE